MSLIEDITGLPNEIEAYRQWRIMCKDLFLLDSLLKVGICLCILVLSVAVGLLINHICDLSFLIVVYTIPPSSLRVFYQQQ